MSDTLTKDRPTNDLGYLEVDAKKIRPMGNRILLQWEESRYEIPIKGTTISLVRSPKHTKMHYTGNVIAVGPDVDPDIQPGMRLIFDQFSNFEKLFDPALGRLALIEVEQQGSCFAIVPSRSKIENGESDYDYSK